jgi:uncharacterized membrane protein
MPDRQSNEQRYFDVLKRIAKGYDSPERIAATAEKRYGVAGGHSNDGDCALGRGARRAT